MPAHIIFQIQNHFLRAEAEQSEWKSLQTTSTDISNYLSFTSSSALHFHVLNFSFLSNMWDMPSDEMFSGSPRIS